MVVSIANNNVSKTWLSETVRTLHQISDMPKNATDFCACKMSMNRSVYMKFAIQLALETL